MAKDQGVFGGTKSESLKVDSISTAPIMINPRKLFKQAIRKRIEERFLKIRGWTYLGKSLDLSFFWSKDDEREVYRCSDGCQCDYCQMMDVLEWDEIARLLQANWKESVFPIGGIFGVDCPFTLTFLWFYNFLNVQYDPYILVWIKKALEMNPKALDDYRKKPKKRRKIFNFLEGQVIKISALKADPSVTKELLQAELIKHAC